MIDESIQADLGCLNPSDDIVIALSVSKKPGWSIDDNNGLVVQAIQSLDKKGSKKDISMEVYEDSFFNDFDEQPPEEISFPRGTNNIEKWIDGNGMPKKSCPIHVRGCIVYNKYLDDHDLTDEKIQSGDKIKFCNLKQPNIFRSHVVAYPPAMNPKAYEEMVDCIDYEAQWEGTFFKPVNVIMECVGWSGERVNKISERCGGDFH